MQPILIAGQWCSANSSSIFRAENPATTELLPEEYPVSTWQDCDAALAAAVEAAAEMRLLDAEKIAAFLEAFAAKIEGRKDDLVKLANQETALPASPRLADNELPRTTNQLRQAAAATKDGSWAMPTLDSKQNIRSVLEPIGPVIVFGPNNFPFAFNSASGGDFAAAIAAGNPVIAKANTSHPGTTKLMAELAHAAAQETAMPPATVQLLYRTSHDDGERFVSDPRVGAVGYTGSRSAGLKLKAAADRTGRPFYAELSSVNPVVILPGALEEKADDIASQFSTSCLMGTGQLCTNPGLVLLLSGPQTERFIGILVEKFKTAPVGTLLSSGVGKSLEKGVTSLSQAGAQILVGGKSGGGKGHSFANTLLRVSGASFLKNPEALQAEAFGNASLFVVADSVEDAAHVLSELEGNLTGCIYSHTQGADDPAYKLLANILRQKVGRLLNDKMPTGVAVSPAMNHGGPFPATSHPGFTAVGIPASLRRFAMLACYDGVRQPRLPAALQDKNPSGKLWRQVDGEWTTRDL
ncbi:MAG: aldehyde dehydrogenase (NADP(+)) [Pirellulaceae bacterium]|nr:aldehyde dehydrogenase (NADP(+)) [Pirellulaceae bacterium]